MNTLQWAFKDTSDHAAAAPEDTASPEPAAAVSVSPRTTEAPVSYTDRDALTAAESYRGLYEELFDGDAVSFCLTVQNAQRIVLQMAEAGYNAYCSENSPLSDPAAAGSFYEKMLSGEATDACFYEVFLDAGFLCHFLTCDGSECTVTRTRLAWQDGGDYALQGTVPTITYSETYAVTDVSLDGGVFRYDYYMPDNPAGGNHDGHVETSVAIPLI